MNRSYTAKQLDRRANQLLRKARNVSPRSDTIRELAEVSIHLEDAPVNPDVVARLTVERANHRRTIVEVHADASFHSFYRYFSQEGNRRSTKRLIRTASRVDGSNLDALARKLTVYQPQTNPIISSKIRILRKRAYVRLLKASPDQLGMLPVRPVARSPFRFECSWRRG